LVGLQEGCKDVTTNVWEELTIDYILVKPFAQKAHSHSKKKKSIVPKVITPSYL
jgi:hypothetical protein